MTATALPRCLSGHVSDTIAAPLVHSPPIPSPSRNRNTASCHTSCANPHAAVNTEYTRMLASIAGRRPARSAINPNATPPMPDATSVIEPSSPAVVVDSDKSRISAAITSAYSMTSNASSAQPRQAASSARRASGVPSRNQVNIPAPRLSAARPLRQWPRPRRAHVRPGIRSRSRRARRRARTQPNPALRLRETPSRSVPPSQSPVRSERTPR